MVLPVWVKEQPACRSTEFFALRKQWMMGGSRFGMEVPVVALAVKVDTLGCWWEAVPPLCLFFCLVLGSEAGAEHFCGMKPGRHIGRDAHETQMVLCGRLGRLGKVNIYPALEPDTHACPRKERVGPR